MKKVILIILVILIIDCLICGTLGYLMSNTQNRTIKKRVSICDIGYTLIDNQCIKEINNIDANIEYSCINGFELQNDTCIRYEFRDAYIDWVCPSGYSRGNGEYKSLCSKLETIPAEEYYYCDFDETLEGTKCIKYRLKAFATVDYVCSTGTPINSDGLCYDLFYSKNKTCSYGGTAISIGNGYYRCVYQPTIEYRCPNDTIRVGTECKIKEYTVRITTLY